MPWAHGAARRDGRLAQPPGAQTLLLGAEALVDARLVRRMRRGAGIGLLVGIALALLYIALGTRVTAYTELLGYSVGVIGFPALFAAIPVVQASGIRGGLGELAALVSITFPLNGILWGAILGAVLRSRAATDGQGD